MSGTGEKGAPEKQWLKRVYDRFRAENGQMGKAAADELLFRGMYAAEPDKPSDTLENRCWRTGRHLPVNREQCEMFGQALNLSEGERRFLIQGYCDRCDRVFEAGTEEAVYRERLAILEELRREYLDKVHPAMKRQLYHAGAKMEHSLRHLYYTDARNYIHFRQEGTAFQVGRHISSINYMSEFGRQMKLLGEIPRKTMIRHLLIFSIPFVNEERLSRWLRKLGYLGLDENHTQAAAGRLDRLLRDGVQDTSFAVSEEQLTSREILDQLNAYVDGHPALPEGCAEGAEEVVLDKWKAGNDGYPVFEWE